MSGTDVTAWRWGKTREDDGLAHFGGRFDDPAPIAGQRWRALYLANSSVAAIAEVLQNTTVDPQEAALDAAVDMQGVEPAARDTLEVYDDALAVLRLSVVTLDDSGYFAALAESRWIMYLREHMRDELATRGIKLLKIGEFLGQDVSLSQKAADLIYQNFPQVGGIIAPSSLGSDFQNFTIFEREPESNQLRIGAAAIATRELATELPEVRLALERLNVITPTDRGELELNSEPTTLEQDLQREARAIAGEFDRNRGEAEHEHERSKAALDLDESESLER